jgi:hypothetical protein
MKRILLVVVMLAASATAAEWPFPSCPATTPDPAGLYRPPMLLFTAAYKFNDKSTAVVSRLTCRDSGAVLFWTYQTGDCNGPCEAAMWAAAIESFLPVDVPHVCEGCLYPQRRRVTADGHQ